MKLLFLGDFYYAYSGIQADILSLSDWIRENDYQVILNLEGGLVSSANPAEKRGIRIHQSSAAMAVLKQLNVVGVCLANNHMMDFGEDALKETLKILDENGIAHTGAGMNLEKALVPMKLGVGEDVALIQNFGWEVEETVYASIDSAGCAPRKEELVLAQTQALRRDHPDAKVITVFHWGFELNPLPQPYDVKLAHDVLDLGGDLIIGHHPHNIQPLERYRGKLIYYSLGNFYFSDKRSNFTKRKFQGATSNLCDYGAMVAYETKSGETEHENLFMYDMDVKESRRILNRGRVLREFTGEDFFSSDYVKRAQEASLNATPILTLDQKENQKKLQRLFRAYRISAVMQNMRKHAIGEKLYSVLKKLYRRAK